MTIRYLIIFLLIFSFINANDKEFTNEELNYINNNKFDVAMLPDFPPFSIYKNNKLSGFSYDILEYISEENNIQFNYIVDTWPNNIKKFKEKNIDIIDAISFKKERLDFTNYTKAYHEIPLVIFSNKDIINYEDINDLKGKKLGITKNIFYKKDVLDLNIFEVIEYDSFQKKLKALALGEVDLIFGHMLSTLRSVKEIGYTNIKVLDELNVKNIKKTDLRFGITKENILLTSIMKKAFENIQDSKWNQLNNKWITSGQVKNIGEIVLTKEEKAYIKQKKILKVQNEKNWPPYNFNINGEAKGFSIDYTNLIAKKLNIQVEYVFGHSWNKYLDMLKKGEIDIINNISQNKERSEYIDFTNIYHTAANAIYVRYGSENIDSLEKLKYKTIVMTKGFFAQELIAKNYPEIKQILVKDSLEALRMLSIGKADATIGKKNVLDYIISTNNISEVTATSFVDDNRLVSLIRMGVPKGETILKNILQKAQDSITYEELLLLKQKWFGIKKTNKVDKKYYLNKEEKLYLESKKVINFCTNNNINPIEFTNDNGKVDGISIDILNSFTQNIDVKFKHVNTTTLKESLDYLKQNKCDFISTIENNQISSKEISYTYPYLSYKLAIITRKNIPVVASIEDIIKEKIALKNDSQLINTLQSTHPNIKIFKTLSNHKALEAINNKKAYYTLAPLPIASYYMSTYAMTDLYISRYSNFTYNINMAVREDNPILLSILNKSIKHLKDEDKRLINNKWSSINLKEKFNYSLFWKIALLLIIVISIIVYRQIMLYKHNNQLTKANKEIALLTNTLEQRVKEEINKNDIKTNQLIHQSRLAQMGELINMIAHQWRQPLTSISATSNNILLKILFNKELDKKELEKELKLISDYSLHLSATIDDFRNFYKKDRPKSIITMESIVNKSLKLIQSSLENNSIEIDLKYTSNKETNTFHTEINHVVLNILKNAEDILLENNILNPKISIFTYFKDNIIYLEITDNGGGIKEENIEKIFEPYFSTKKSKDGTGLGLYMSKLIIEEHCHGKLSVKNTNTGVTFKISIPKDGLIWI